MKMMMPMRFMVLVCFLVACTKPNPAATCPEGFCIDSEFGFCDVDGAISGMPGTCIAVACTPGEFEVCRGEQAITCNTTGDDFDLELCPFGCGDGGCLPCEEGEVSCSDGNLFRCDGSGNAVMEETCLAGCVADERPHCAYLEPRYAPDICDTPATVAEFSVSGTGTFDPNLDNNCTGGVIEQAGTTSLCVVHYGSITLQSSSVLTVTGRPDRLGRVVMFVADEDLNIEGTLDVSATGSHNGPGGGVTQSGGTSNLNSGFGAGGAGGATQGGSGGSLTANSGANNAGPVAMNPGVLQALVGGAAAAQFVDSSGVPGAGGGGGGGVALVSCRGRLSVVGVINANGGGGFAGSNNLFRHGFGGGAGGNVVLQGLDVSVTGKIFSNGGGGGGGMRASGTAGVAGKDGVLSATTPAIGGTPQDGEGAGGNGGVTGMAANGGGKPTSASAGAGGGGGSVGFIQTYTPAGIDPVLTPLAVSPAFQPNGTINTR